MYYKLLGSDNIKGIKKNFDLHAADNMFVFLLLPQRDLNPRIMYTAATHTIYIYDIPKLRLKEWHDKLVHVSILLTCVL